MTEVYINNKFVELASGFSIKLIDENPYFTKSSKYTYDIEIPLRGNPANIANFGSLQRIDVSKVIVEMPARVVADGRVLIDGTASLTAVTRDSIKVQILSGTALLNFLSKYNDLYIDTLHLGYITRPDGTAFADDEAVRTYVNSLSESDRYKFLFGKYGDSNYVFMPVYKSSFKTCYNNMGYFDFGDGKYSLTFDTTYYFEDGGNKMFGDFNDFKTVNGRLAVQPYVCYLIRIIFAALGYTVTELQIEDTYLRNLFAANANNITDFAQLLPHWTVAELMTEIEHFFGVVIRIDDRDKTMRIIGRDNFYKSGNGVVLDFISDGYSVSSDINDSKDISDSDIGYSLSAAKATLKIDDSIIKKVTKKVFDSYELLYTYYISLDDVAKGSYLYEADGRQYMDYVDSNDSNKTHKLLEINQFRNLIRSDTTSDSNSIELRIVPVNFVTAHRRWANGKSYGMFTSGLEFIAPVMAPSEVTYDKQTNNLQALIEGDGTDTGNSKSILEVALYDGTMYDIRVDTSVWYKWPYPFVLAEDSRRDAKVSLQLNKVTGIQTMYDMVYGKLNKMNTKSEYCIRFVDNNVYDAMSKFIINNKEFLCEKIEYQILPKGIGKLKTGYFYEA